MEWVAVEGFLLGGGLQPCKLLAVKDGFMDLAGRQTLGDDLDGVAQRHSDDNLDRLGEDRPAKDHVRLELLALHQQPLIADRSLVSGVKKLGAASPQRLAPIGRSNAMRGEDRLYSPF